VSRVLGTHLRLLAVRLTILAAAVTCGYLAWQRSAVVFDDAFISYRYASNLVAGNGLVFNPGERVEGYTNFAWVLGSAAALAAGLDPFQATRSLGVLSYLAVIAGCGAYLLFGSLDTGWRSLAPAPLLAALVLPSGLAAMAGTGMETSFLSACLLGVGLQSHVWRPRTRSGRAGASLLPLLACLVRLDASLIVAASAGATLLEGGLRRERLSRTVQALLWRFGPTALGVLVYRLWAASYYGEILPNTYYAKAADLWSWAVGFAYLRAFAANSPQALLLGGLALLGIALAWRTAQREFGLFCLLALLLFAVYVAKVGGDFMYYRFAFEVYPLLVCAAAIGLQALARLGPRGGLAALALAGTAVAFSTTPPVLDKARGMQSMDEMNRYALLGGALGVRLRAVLPPDTIIATTLAGTVPYYSDLETIDQWGLSDRFVAHLPAAKITYRGHAKRAPTDYLRERGVNLEFDHPEVCDCGSPCDDDAENAPFVFVRLPGDLCVRSRYLVETQELTAHLCARPDAFVLRRVDCGATTRSSRPPDREPDRPAAPR
jgi:arabinofuranosyltransferase